MDKNSRVVELEKELAHLKRQVETGIYDPYYSVHYWRERCLRAERDLDLLKLNDAEKNTGDRKT